MPMNMRPRHFLLIYMRNSERRQIKAVINAVSIEILGIRIHTFQDKSLAFIDAFNNSSSHCFQFYTRRTNDNIKKPVVFFHQTA